MFAGWMTYLMATLNRRAEAAAIKVEAVKLAAIRTASAVEDVKKTAAEAARLLAEKDAEREDAKKDFD